MDAAQALTAIADGIEGRQNDAQVMALLAQARTACQLPTASQPPAGEARLSTVLEAWQQVWPRLSAQRDFRLAVAREARLWAKRVGS